MSDHEDDQRGHLRARPRTEGEPAVPSTITGGTEERKRASCTKRVRAWCRTKWAEHGKQVEAAIQRGRPHAPVIGVIAVLLVLAFFMRGSSGCTHGVPSHFAVPCTKTQYAWPTTPLNASTHEYHRVVAVLHGQLEKNGGCIAAPHACMPFKVILVRTADNRTAEFDNRAQFIELSDPAGFREDSAFCPQAKQIVVKRFKHVTAVDRYGRNHTFTGQRAHCLQYMMDLIETGPSVWC